MTEAALFTPKAQKAPAMTTKALLERLQASYIQPNAPMPGGIFVPEVGINGNFGASSRCDAIYVGFTSASGRIMVGHELKVSRADWRHELDKIDKADTWADACHAWYVVAPSTDIVPPEELPHGWGLMIPDPRGKVRFTKIVKATVRADHAPPWWAVRSVMSRADTLRANNIEQQVRAARTKIAAEERDRYDKQVEARSSAASPAAEAALDVVQAFKRKGITLAEMPPWNREPEAKTVLSPQMVEGLVPILQQGLDAARLLTRLTERYSGVGSLERTVKELVDAVAALKAAEVVPE